MTTDTIDIIDNIDPTIYHDIVVFDPASAEKFLEEKSFPHNRSIRAGKVQLLATKMKTGRYKDNGTPSISVAKDGHLRNGHHTLLAVMQGDVTIRLRVAWNVPDDTFSTFDTGALRTVADVLASDGHTNTHQLAALLRPIIRCERGFRSSRLFASDEAAGDPILPSDYEDALAVWGEEIRAAAAFANQNKGSVSGRDTGRIRRPARAMFNPTALGLAHYLLHSKPGGEDYLLAMTSGVNLTYGSPALAVRNYFTTSNPLRLLAISTILRGYRRVADGQEWRAVDTSKFIDNPKLWEV